MQSQGILIANRGEISIRIARAAADMGIRSVAVYSSDDQTSLHTKIANEAELIPGLGAQAYLDIDQIIQAAKNCNCDAIHPGYGFLSERAELAVSCAAAGITFIGPREDHLKLFGDKGAARRAAIEAGVPVLRGTDHAVNLEQLTQFFDTVNGSIIIKAVAGGPLRLKPADLDPVGRHAVLETRGFHLIRVSGFLPVLDDVGLATHQGADG